MTTALALRDAGIEPLVFERREALSKIRAGSGFHLWQNAMRALQQLGIAEPVVAAGETVERMEWRNPRGDFIAEWPVGQLSEQVGAPAIGILRTGLSETLAKELGEGVVRLDANATSFEDDGDGVTIRFDDGTSERVDVLIGADGVNSMVRSQFYGRTEPRYAGYTLWHGHIAREQCIVSKEVPPHLFRETWGRATRFGFYPVKGELYWFCIRKVPQGGTEQPSERKAAVLEHVGDWAVPARGLVEDTGDGDIQRVDIVGRRPSKHWGQGRVTLLGDAAHAMTPNLGQGACQAIEDGVVLARTLKSGPQDPVAALREYESLRAARTASFQRRAWMIGSTGRWQNPVVVKGRDRIMKAVFPTLAWKAQVKDAAYDF
jgi:2-polyprenyl-6-methoxyphenol hydroxylase-like FAD-dependent oxidoreductase